MSTHRRIGSGAVVCLPILLQSMNAMAADNSAPSSPPTVARASGDWTLAAGVGFGGLSYGVLPYASAGPVWGMTIERKLGRHIWMLLGATGNYVAFARGNALLGSNETRQWSAEGHAGLRYVFNPGRAFEFSSYVMAGASGGAFLSEGSGQRVSTTGVHGTLGITVDRELTEGFGVRLSSNLASAGWSSSKYNYGGDPGIEQSDAGFYGALALQPTVALRMTF